MEIIIIECRNCSLTITAEQLVDSVMLSVFEISTYYTEVQDLSNDNVNSIYNMYTTH